MYVLNDGILSFTSINFYKIETRFNVKKKYQKTNKKHVYIFYFKITVHYIVSKPLPSKCEESQTK